MPRTLSVILMLLAVSASASAEAAGGKTDGTAEDIVAAAIAERQFLQVPRMVHASRAALERAADAALAGDGETARGEIEAAIAYDPGSPRAYLARAHHSRSPGEKLSAYVAALGAARYGYPNQLVFSLNAFLVVLWSVMLGILGAGGAIVFRYLRHVHHTLYESLQRRLGKHAAMLATVLLLVPALWGTGLVALVVYFLLWFRSIMRPRERAIAYALATITLVAWAAHTYSPGPLRAPGEGHTAYRIGVAAETAGTDGYYDPLSMDEPAGYLHWVRALGAKRRGDLELAATEFTAAAEALPRSWGIHTNIGNVHLLRGDLQGALASYDRAIEIEPAAAEAHLNRAQVLTDLVDFIAADEAMEHAMTHGYERVSSFLAAHEVDSRRAVMDVLPSPGALWDQTIRSGLNNGPLDLPAGLRFLFPGGRVAWTPISLVVMIVLGIVAGKWLERSVKTFSCTSCARIICRRCLLRVDGHPYCLDCGQTLRAECSAEHSRALLERYFQRGYSMRSALSGAVRWLLPGWAEVSEWPVLRSAAVLSLCGAALLVVSIRSLPIPGYPADAPAFASDPLAWGLGVTLYAIARVATWRWSRTTQGPGDADADDDREILRHAS